MRVHKMLCVIIVITLLATVCLAGDFSFTGTFSNVNQVQFFTINISSGSNVVIQSYGYGGGTNASGVLITGGGFDPSVALFHGAGPSAPLYKTTDDEYGCAQGTRDTATGVCYDIYWQGTSQPTAPGAAVVGFEPGTYVVALTNYGNFANGLTLGAGFSNTGSGFTCGGNARTVNPDVFTDCLGSARDGHWALDIRGVDSAQLGIVKPKLVVEASDVSREYGSGNPVLTGTITGLANGDSITATYASAATAASAVGTYPILPTIVDPAGQLAGYDVTITNATLSVTLAPLTVVAANASRLVGDANPVFIGTVTGVMNGDGISPTYSTAATVASPAGTYSIVPKLLDPAGKLGNYAVAATNGVLTINAPAAPQPLAVTPNAGSGASTVLTALYSDQSGYAAIASTRTIVNTAISNAKACGVLYTAAGQTLAITNDVGTAYLTPTKLGTAAVIENSQCSINLASSSVSGDGNTLTLKLSISFKPTFVGAKNVYMLSQDKAGSSSGWQTRGTWTVPPEAPSAVSVTPSSGTRGSQLFQLTYSDPAGVGAITAAKMIINNVVSNAKACATLYSPTTETLAIVNDAGTAYGPPVKLGTAGAVIQNSQCSIDLSASSASGIGTTLTLNLPVTFTPTFTGAKNIYLLTQNKFGLNSGWQLLGTWLP